MLNRNFLPPKGFQFTTSQGGRRDIFYDLFGNVAAFNSRPHKEVDVIPAVSNAWDTFFQFTTSQGGRPLLNPFSDISVSFQFTTSQGGRLERRIL